MSAHPEVGLRVLPEDTPVEHLEHHFDDEDGKRRVVEPLGKILVDAGVLWDRGVEH